MTHTLVPSDLVEGAPVCTPAGERLGAIERLMLDKSSGTVAYAVLRCGGFLGMGEHHYPVPWDRLRYNTERHAFDLDMTADDLRNGPSELDGEAFDWGDRSTPYRHPQYWTV